MTDSDNIENIIWNAYWNYDIIQDLTASSVDTLKNIFEFEDIVLLANFVYNSVFDGIWDDIE